MPRGKVRFDMTRYQKKIEMLGKLPSCVTGR